MWTDNETIQDLLGFEVHANLIKSVVTERTLLPVTVGVFGNWGGGKSSVMRMLESSFQQNDQGVACLYFNSWTFEGYDDAKSAILSSILLQLTEHKKMTARAKGMALGLLQKVKWMRALNIGIKGVGIPLVASSVGVDPITATALGMFGASAELKPEEIMNQETVASILNQNPTGANPVFVDIRAFREEFSKMLAETNITTLVVLIDDLDRCMPERIIETLEAVKLFLSVPDTAFIIAADPRIVRHAIRVRYSNIQTEDLQAESEELVTDYLEKLIQIPYYLPSLSPSEVESYINLLLCQLHLDQSNFQTLLDNYYQLRVENHYLTYNFAAVKAACTETPLILDEQLVWSSSIAPLITEGLKGNPRQIKRFLNALMLRVKLAEVAKLTIKADVLVKLMLLEYTKPKLFEQLFLWQVAGEGLPFEIELLENRARGKEVELESGLADIINRWEEKSIQEWLKMDPKLEGVDLRDYFWVSRDRLSLSQTNVKNIPPFLRKLFDQLISKDRGQQQMSAREIKNLGMEELDTIIELVRHYLQKKPDEAKILIFIMEQPNLFMPAINILDELPSTQIPASIPISLSTIGQKSSELKSRILESLVRLANGTGKVANAAKQAIETLQ